MNSPMSVPATKKHLILFIQSLNLLWAWVTSDSYFAVSDTGRADDAR